MCFFLYFFRIVQGWSLHFLGRVQGILYYDQYLHNVYVWGTVEMSNKPTLLPDSPSVDRSSLSSRRQWTTLPSRQWPSTQTPRHIQRVTTWHTSIPTPVHQWTCLEPAVVRLGRNQREDGVVGCRCECHYTVRNTSRHVWDRKYYRIHLHTSISP